MRNVYQVFPDMFNNKNKKNNKNTHVFRYVVHTYAYLHNKNTHAFTALIFQKIFDVVEKLIRML